MPIDAILFGGRRSTVVPLVTEAFDWEHGVFLGATMGSEKTAAAAGTVGELRFDPFAMLPVLRLQHGRLLRPLAEDRAHAPGRKLPKIFYVNWFRKDDDGRFLWPGFGENSRVLAWVFARCAGHGAAQETPIGLSRRSGRRHRHGGLEVTDEQRRRAAARGHRRVARPAAAVPRALRHASTASRPSSTRSCKALEARLA